MAQRNPRRFVGACRANLKVRPGNALYGKPWAAPDQHAVHGTRRQPRYCAEAFKVRALQFASRFRETLVSQAQVTAELLHGTVVGNGKAGNPT
jgi:hypothetical protein